jgi:hypothetical protein
MNKGNSSEYSRSRVYYHTQKHRSTGNIPKAGYTHYTAVNVHATRCTYYKLLAPVRVRKEHRSFPPRPSTMQKLWLWYVCEKNTSTVLFHPALPLFKHYLYKIIEHLLTSSRNVHPWSRFPRPPAGAMNDGPSRSVTRRHLLAAKKSLRPSARCDDQNYSPVGATCWPAIHSLRPSVSGAVDPRIQPPSELYDPTPVSVLHQ